MSKLAFVFGIPLSLVLFVGCAKEEKHPIPNVNVYFSIDLANDNTLQFEGNAIFYKGHGYLGFGVIVGYYNKEEYSAYDATCPKHLDSPKAVQLTSGRIATCPYCNTTYQLDNYGLPIQANKTTNEYPLKKYRVSKYDRYITVYN